MVTELPKLRRCCFCIPLRRGLLFWSYLHMVATFMIGAYGIYMWLLMLTYCITFNFCYLAFDVSDAIVFNIAINSILSGLLIYGAHKKNHKILKINYYGATVSVITFSIMVIIDFSIRITRYWDLVNIEGRSNWVMRMLLFGGAMYTTYILIQLYVIVLVRSEVFKLRDNQQFQFTNNAADAEANCTLHVGNNENSNLTEQQN